MTKEEIQIYTRRISSGNKTELVVTTYDIILTYIRDAKEALSRKDAEGFIWNLNKSMDFLNELIHALDCKYEVGRELLALYRYMQEIISNCILKKTEQNLDVMEHMTEKLKASFQEVAKLDNSGPVISNGGQVYAGLTYGKSSLNELYDNTSHGFQA